MIDTKAGKENKEVSAEVYVRTMLFKLWLTLSSTYVLITEKRSLKEQCHEDFVVLGQFCAKIIT